MSQTPQQQQRRQFGQQQQQQQSPQQQQQQNERNRQHHELMMNQAGAYYPSSNYSLSNGQMMADQQPTSMGMHWPSDMQPQRGIEGGNQFGNMNFSPNNYYDANQADAEIDAILSNYQPKLYSSSSMQSGSGNLSAADMTGKPESFTSQHGSQQGSNKSSSVSGMGADQLDPATALAAAAAYGHLGYPSMGGVGEVNAPPRGSEMENWTSGQNQSGNQGSNRSGLDFQSSYDVKLGSGNVSADYDGDASGTSSAQTPGGISSGDDSNSGKRRRMTVGGGGGTAAAKQQERFEAGQSTGGADGRGATAAQEALGRPTMQHHNNSYVDTKSLEKMAQESLFRAGQENNRPIANFEPATPSKVQPSRPPIRQRRSHSGSQVPTGSTAVLANLRDQHSGPTMTKRLSVSSAGAPSTMASVQQAPSIFSVMEGHAASHPPGLGGVRPGDGGGHAAATDFTKRKGWPTRIVEELLDFVHVLDRQGRVLFAAPSVLTLTGWTAEELKGRELTDFIHPDDVAGVKEEFERTLSSGSDLIVYNRFQRKPQTAADKQRIRDQRDANHVVRSRSGSTSGGDTSSNQDVVATNNQKSTFASGSLDNQFVTGASTLRNQDEDFLDDADDKYVIFEATGHPYIPPDGASFDLDAHGDSIDKFIPDVLGKVLSTPMKTEEGESRNLDKGVGNSQASEIQCYFCSCRVFPTKNVGMLDSFLELKLENERLRTLLGQLSMSEAQPSGTGADARSDGRRSFEESQAGYHLDYFHEMEQQHQSQQSSMGHGSGMISQSMANHPSDIAHDTQRINRRVSIPYTTGSLNSTPTSPLLSQALERSHTGTGTSGGGGGGGGGEDSDDGASVKSGAADEKKKKKKGKPEEGDYVCTDCGRVDSPEWRKGPLGPKTLCNACGLRWAKKVKRNGGDPNAIAMAARPAKGQIKAQAAAARAQKQNQQSQRDHGDLTQSGPPPLTSGDSSSFYPSNSPSDLGNSNATFQDFYGDQSMHHQMANQHNFYHLNNSMVNYDSSMQQQQQPPPPGHSHYSQMN